MEHVIKAAVDRGASDIHIKAGDVFRARIAGELRPLTKQRLTPEQTKAIAEQLIPSQDIRELIDSVRDYDCTWGSPGIGRFRINISKQRSSFMIVMRVIPFDVPTIEKLALPQAVEEIAGGDSGLVLITGATGSGRSSTLAAMVHFINTTMNKHIVTLESPIEYLHRDLNSSVTQREVGVDTTDVVSGLRAALRQDCNVIALAELVDAEVVDLAIKAAESGRLVMSTMHTPDATATLARLVSWFPWEEQEVARLRLAGVIRGIVSQQLLPRADDEGRCVATEILIATPEFREVIADRRRAGDVQPLIADAARSSEMRTFAQRLVELVKSKTITEDTARAAMGDPEEFDRLLSGRGPPKGQERRKTTRDRRKGVKDRRRRSKPQS